MFADFVPGTGRAALSVAISTSLDAATLLNKLDTYPFGCSEQITSMAMAMLYMKDLAGEAHFSIAGDIDQRLQDAVNRLLSRQDSNGSFGLWSVGGNDAWLDAYVTDFLTRARERGLQGAGDRLHAGARPLAQLRRQQSGAAQERRPRSRLCASMCWRATRRRPSATCAISPIPSSAPSPRPIGKAQIGGGARHAGRQEPRRRCLQCRADADIPAKPTLEIGRIDFGSMLRNSAALVTLASESDAAPRIVDDAVLRVDAARALSSYTSTQEDAWLVLAARALAEKLNAISLTVNGDDAAGRALPHPARRSTGGAAEGDQ